MRATQTDPASHFVSAYSSTVNVTVYAAPPAPLITSVSTPAATKSTTSVTVGGTGVAGDTITLYDNGVAIGTVVVGAGGSWSLTVKLALGSHSLTATQTYLPGVVSGSSAALGVLVHS